MPFSDPLTTGLGYGHNLVVARPADERRARQAELIGFMDIDGVWCVFHAMVPPTKKFKRELGWR